MYIVAFLHLIRFYSSENPEHGSDTHCTTQKVTDVVTAQQAQTSTSNSTNLPDIQPNDHENGVDNGFEDWLDRFTFAIDCSAASLTG